VIFGDGIDKPRFIVIGIQAKPNNVADDQFNNSIFNIPTDNLPSQIDVKKVTTTFNDKIITTDYVNNFSRNEAAIDGITILRISVNRITVIWVKMT